MDEKNRQQRRAIRFEPSRLEHALVMYRADGVPFAPEDVGLIMDQSAKGAQIAVKANPKIAFGLRLMVKLGRLDPLPATIIWIKEPDAELRRLGLEFVESR